MDFECRIIRSNRRTLALEITREGALLVRAPKYATEREILSFVEKHKDWTAAKLKEHRDRIAMSPAEPLTGDQLKELGKAAAEYIPMRAAHYAALMGVDFNRITLRNQKSRWGSCSSQGNLNFNVLLMLMPKEVIDSVIVHELCHLRHMNHSRAFYDEVLKYCPDYYRLDNWLKENGDAIMRRMPA